MSADLPCERPLEDRRRADDSTCPVKPLTGTVSPLFDFETRAD